MRRLSRSLPRSVALLATLMLGCAPVVYGQRHSLGSAPPTAPTLTPARPATPPPAARPAPVPAVHTPPAAPVPFTNHAIPLPPPPGPVAAISSGLGAIQFTQVSLGVPAPQSLMRQLASDDERARQGALSSLGAPGQYLNHGHVPAPHSMQLDMLQLSTSSELDAVLTVELDQHVVSAILVPDTGGTWRRLATLSFASSFSAGTTTPSNFMRPLRSWLEPGRYRAAYHATVNGPNGDFTENEADLRIINGHAEIVMSFVSGARQCEPATQPLHGPHLACDILQRWLEPDPADPTHHFLLITGTGHFPLRDTDDPLSRSRSYRLTRLRSFACQPFVFSDQAQEFAPTANSAPCAAREPAPPRPEHLSAIPPAEHP